MKSHIKFWDPKWSLGRLGIIGLIVAIFIFAALVTPITGHGEARPTVARTQIDNFKTVIGAFWVDNEIYPATLEDLVKKPAYATNWHGPYLEKIPRDPWNNAYVYKIPGVHNANTYDISATAPDGHIFSNWEN